eukprot:NODE_2577_length_1388_cov_36.618182_g2449_i0.p1 GENE.NODE_2577_length_1388_cov_36.618182_g2449_i0~~NODE_2577_length_1388_cov_36.618182_g2449_i0.p1  ORF type:complete len:414 (-),score=58.80 NODE_2577_length_1388_cov_36.618182_g2449_i0:62-1303(-)
MYTSAAVGTSFKLMFQSPLPVNNKSVFIMSSDITQPVSVLKRQLHEQEKFPTPLAQLDFYIDGVLLDDNRSLSSYQSLTHKAIIGIRGAYYDFTVQTALVPYSVSIKWSNHITVTDMLKAVWRKMGIDLNRARFRINDRDIDFKHCYKYTEDVLPWDATLQDLGMTATPDTHHHVKFRRCRTGKAFHFSLNCFGYTTIRDIHDQIAETEAKDKAKQEAEAMPSKLPKEVPDYKYDDEDEFVSPLGNKRVYLYTPSMAQYVKEDLATGEPYFSYHPPTRGQPLWVDLEMDFSVPHLSDLGVKPGATVILDFWSDFYNSWSSEIGLNPTSSDLITIRTLKGHLIRLPVNMSETVEDILLRVWCASGDEPQEIQLQLDDGRILPEWKSLVDLGVMVESTLQCVHQAQNNLRAAGKA